MDPTGDTDWIPYVVIDMGFVGHTVSLTVMCHYKRFDIQVNAKDLKVGPDDLPLYQEFMAMCEDPIEGEEEVEDWAIQPCLPSIRKLAPAPDKHQTFSLEDYFNAQTIVSRLRAENGVLIADQIPPNADSLNCFPPRLMVSDPRLNIPDLDLVLQYDASELIIIPTLGPGGIDYCDIPLQVKEAGSGRHLAFKAATDSKSVVRELRAYCRFISAEEDPTPYLSHLEGLVMLGSEVLGLLIKFIENSGTMLSCAAEASQEEKDRWFEQIERTVEYLHHLDLSWGDVKPDNVLIELDGNAYVIDFGGGFAPQWVEERLANSKAGDIFGLDKLRSFLQYSKHHNNV